jgi:hypothetical protein
MTITYSLMIAAYSSFVLTCLVKMFCEWLEQRRR